MKKTNLIIFEGAHRVGKTTLINELQESDGVLNLYGDTSLWDNQIKPNVKDSKLYEMQFISSLRNTAHLLMTLDTGKYHTILIDRWYLSSLFWIIKRMEYVNYFEDMNELIEYVDGVDKKLHEHFNMHHLIFRTRRNNYMDLDYDMTLNNSEVETIRNLKKMLSNGDRITTIELESVGGYFDIKEKFASFVESKQ